MSPSSISQKFVFQQNHEFLGGLNDVKKISNFQWQLDPGKFLTESEVKRLMKVIGKRKRIATKRNMKTPIRDFFVIDLAINTGLRVKEISDLNLNDLLIQNGNSALIVRSGKGGKYRVVKFSLKFRDSLIEYLDWKNKVGEPCQPNDPLILSSITNKAMTTRGLQKVFERNAKVAGIEGHSIHHLRHTYASNLYKSSRYNLRLVQKQLGHASILTTQIYADVFSPDLDRALERLYEC